MNISISYQLLNRIKVAARWSLGLVWLYEGVVPKIFFVAENPAQTALVIRSGIYYPSPEFTLIALGVAQAIMGLLLLSGWAERKLVAIATAGMAILMVLVAMNKPDMLYDPFGALAKDLCLFVCAYVVWSLSPLLKREGGGEMAT